MIEQNGIDIYRQDFNIDPLPFFRETDEKDRRGITEIKYINGLYKLWDALIDNFPSLLIDNCSSGGRRLDLESLKRSVLLWRSDTGCFPETNDMRINLWSQNQISSLSEYIPYHSCAVWNFDAYTVRSNATHGLACNFYIFSADFDFASAEKALEESKRLEHHWHKDFYPLTAPSIDESIWFAYALSDGEDSVAYVFRREFSEIESAVIKLPCINPDLTYRITVTNEQYDTEKMLLLGSDLVDGLRVSIPKKRSSVIIEYRKA
jgi:alpha-galactosidase